MPEPVSETIQNHTLRDGVTEVTVLSMGAAVQDWRIAGRRVILGYANPEDYRHNPGYLGAIVGRVANRISQARFEMDGAPVELVANDGPHQLHGGPKGLSHLNWHMEPEGPRAVRLTHISPHLDMGYPGEIAFEVRISLEDFCLKWEMTGHPDRPTPIALAQHLYFNLNGAGDVRDHKLQIAAPHITPTDAGLIPDGRIAPVTDTRFDFQSARELREADPSELGYDVNFALAPAAFDGGPAAELVGEDGMRLRLWTDQPGLQVYSSGGLSPFGTPWPDVRHGPFAGLCLEAQAFPNAVNTPNFPSVICTPDHPYQQVTRIDISPN